MMVNDPDTGEVELMFSGVRREFDQEKGLVVLDQLELVLYSKPTRNEPKGHDIRLYASHCVVEGVGRADAKGQEVFRFSGGLRGFLDQDVRLWASEGTFDRRTKILHCPKMTRLVHFTWPADVNLLSMLVFAGPPEMEWLQLAGAPAPDFELVGEEFEFDAASDRFTAGRKGRLRITGRPEDALRTDRKKSRPASNEPTELRSEGPLRLQILGTQDSDARSTLLVTAERDVVVERRSQGATTRTRSDSATVHIRLPPKAPERGDPRPLSMTLKGGVTIDDTRGYSATGDQVEWTHQDDLLRLSGAPHVEVRQASQRLQAREVIIDRPNRVVDFRGDIVATILAERDAPDAPGATPRTLTLIPAELQMTMDASGRPLSLRAWNGVRISGHLGATGPDAVEAEGREFEWNLGAGEGTLRGDPFARIVQGPNLVVAPLVSFRGRSYMVIKGPKLLRFFAEMDPALNGGATLLEASLGLRGLQQIPGRREAALDLAVTSVGDAVIDQESRRVNLVDSCVVRTQDSSLFSDRLFVVFAEDGRKFERVLGLGNVRASMSQAFQDPIQIEGETLELLGTFDLTVRGHPWGRGRMGSDEMTFRRFQYNLKTRLLAIDGVRMQARF